MIKFLLAFLICNPLLAADVFSVALRTEFRYADFETQCFLPGMAENFRFSAEVENGRVVRAILKKVLLSGFSEVLELDPSEMKNIEIHEVSHSLWVKSWPVSGRVLWMLMRGGTEQGLDTCYPPEDLASVNPSAFQFVFQGLDNGGNPFFVDSNTAVFQGKTISGRNYRIELSLTQDRI